jgi:hypothetical protein
MYFEIAAFLWSALAYWSGSSRWKLLSLCKPAAISQLAIGLPLFLIHHLSKIHRGMAHLLSIASVDTAGGNTHELLCNSPHCFCYATQRAKFDIRHVPKSCLLKTAYEPLEVINPNSSELAEAFAAQSL